MNVVNVLFEDRYGGPQRRVIEVGKRLWEQHGVKTTLILPYGDGNAEQRALKSGLDVHRIAFERVPKPNYPFRVIKWLLLLPRDIWRFYKVYRGINADIIHVNGAFFLAPGLAAKLAGIPLVWHLNDTIVGLYLGKILGRIVHGLADKVVVAAEAVAVHYGIQNLQHNVIYAPVDIQEFTPIQKTNSSQKKHVIGIIANWSPIKGLEYFVEAASIIFGELDNNVRFVMIGARIETHREYAEKVVALIDAFKISESVELMGHCEHVPEELVKFNVLVLSSTTEACPMSVLEAMASGVPVVASDVGGVRELLLPNNACDGAAGIVVPVQDARAIAEAVLLLLGDINLASQQGRNGRLLVEEGFSLNSCVERHMDIYKVLANTRLDH